MTWLTYKQASIALGVAPASVKQRARRSHWQRQPGNDGEARVNVPDELLLSGATSPPTSPASAPPTSPVSEIIERLEADLLEARIGQAVARAELARVDALVVDLRTDRDYWRHQANLSWWRRLVG